MGSSIDEGEHSSWRTIVIRVWEEPDRGFRARVTRSAQRSDEPSLLLATDPEQVVDAVRSWLADPRATVSSPAERARD
jgi:hypothetical protein